MTHSVRCVMLRVRCEMWACQPSKAAMDFKATSTVARCIIHSLATSGLPVMPTTTAATAWQATLSQHHRE